MFWQSFAYVLGTLKKQNFGTGCWYTTRRFVLLKNEILRIGLKSNSNKKGVVNGPYFRCQYS